jgi:hypothetical protein
MITKIANDKGCIFEERLECDKLEIVKKYHKERKGKS